MRLDVENSRTCVAASRERCAGTVRLRWFQADDGSPWPDWSGRARTGGRGAWSCARIACVEAGIDRGGFARAFRAPVKRVDAETLVGRARTAGERLFFERVGLANRAGVAAVGQAAAREAMRGGGWLLLVAADASETTVSRFVANASRKEAPMAYVRSGAELGRALGREFVSVVVIASSRFSADIEALCDGLIGFESAAILRMNAAAASAVEVHGRVDTNGV